MNRWVFNFDGKWLVIGFSSVVLIIMNVHYLVALNYTEIKSFCYGPWYGLQSEAQKYVRGLVHKKYFHNAEKRMKRQFTNWIVIYWSTFSSKIFKKQLSDLNLLKIYWNPVNRWKTKEMQSDNPFYGFDIVIPC